MSTTSPRRTPDRQCVSPEFVRITQWKRMGLASSNASQESSSSLLSLSLSLSSLPLNFRCSWRKICRNSSLCPLLRFPNNQSETPQAANMNGTTNTDAVVAHRGTCCCCCCCSGGGGGGFRLLFRLAFFWRDAERFRRWKVAVPCARNGFQWLLLLATVPHVVVVLLRNKVEEAHLHTGDSSVRFAHAVTTTIAPKSECYGSSSL